MAIARKTRTRVHGKLARVLTHWPRLRRRVMPTVVAAKGRIAWRTPAIRRVRVICVYCVNYYSNNLSAITLPRPHRSSEVIAMPR